MDILPFIQIKQDDLALVGTKGLSLGKLAQAKFLVPEGFVVTSQVFDDFLHEKDINVAIQTELEKINLQDIHSVDYASRVLTEVIKSADIKLVHVTEILQQFKHINAECVAVRSSIYSSNDYSITWAGELGTYLNVDAGSIINHVKRCWAGLFSTRSLYYLHQQKLTPDQIKMSVVVQRMINSDIWGLTYTQHPVSRDNNQVVIEACFGLGDEKTKSLIMPDTYIVAKDSLKIIDKNVHPQEVASGFDPEGGTKIIELQAKVVEKQKLSDKQINQLVEICKRVEKEFGHPVEIEWLYVDDFYMVQAKEIRVD